MSNFYCGKNDMKVPKLFRQLIGMKYNNRLRDL